MYLRCIIRNGPHQISYVMSNGSILEFKALKEMIDVIHIALGDVEFKENIHSGHVATVKYIKTIFEGHGLLGVKMYLDSLLEDLQVETEECPRCNEEVPVGQVQRRHSAQVYAGRFCEDCAIKGYRDHCGLDMPMLTQADVDEIIESEDYY